MDVDCPGASPVTVLVPLVPLSAGFWLVNGEPLLSTCHRNRTALSSRSIPSRVMIGFPYGVTALEVAAAPGFTPATDEVAHTSKVYLVPLFSPDTQLPELIVPCAPVWLTL